MKATTNWWLIILCLPLPFKIFKLIHALVCGMGVLPWCHHAIWTLISLSTLWELWAVFVCMHTLSQWKWTPWQLFLCCSAKWGACSFSLSRLFVCALEISQKFFFKNILKLIFSLPFVSCGGPLYFVCLAYSDSFWFPPTAPQNLPIHTRHATAPQNLPIHTRYAWSYDVFFLAGKDQQQNNQPNHQASG